uniref:Integrase, catalytic region, zinc finger, CCHC-type, peptidase aspartic, catalytic n=1 Tax=Tanacetum cinerariifolium TaxID=118510 RepID=A0A6L2NVI6_TANCI|nr:integrase, catalytic region, zinc finger, CCHC-type, peptidase aspartic, catalytic [Tanacetum cinerariifolium]
MGKSKKKSHKPKSKDTNKEKLYLLYMDLCGPMRVESVNEKKYILVIIDDYSQFTWVKCLRSKDEAPDFIIKFFKMIQVRLKVGISHETSIARSLQQNGVVERQAVGTACYTQNRSIVCLSYGKTPYELLHGKLPDLSVDPPAPAVIASIAKVIDPVLAESTGSSSSTTVDQDAPSLTTQEELNEFERLEVWELVPQPDKVMVITLKWIYKVKVDELGGILKNKARLVTCGYRQDEGIDFEESFAPVARL